MSVKIDLSKWEFTQKDLEEKSIAQILAQQSEDIIDDFWNSVTDEEAKTLKTDWSFWGRPKQFVPEESTIHVLADLLFIYFPPAGALGNPEVHQSGLDLLLRIIPEYR